MLKAKLKSVNMSWVYAVEFCRSFRIKWAIAVNASVVLLLSCYANWHGSRACCTWENRWPTIMHSRDFITIEVTAMGVKSLFHGQGLLGTGLIIILFQDGWMACVLPVIWKRGHRAGPNSGANVLRIKVEMPSGPVDLWICKFKKNLYWLHLSLYGFCPSGFCAEIKNIQWSNLQYNVKASVIAIETSEFVEQKHPCNSTMLSFIHMDTVFSTGFPQVV